MNIKINRVKIVVTVPKENTKEVLEAMFEAGAGTLSNSNYTCCSSCVDSIGTFLPGVNAKPYIGTINKLETVKEDRLEVICEVDKVKRVISELRKTHPYEEPAIDIIPLVDENNF